MGSKINDDFPNNSKKRMYPNVKSHSEVVPDPKLMTDTQHSTIHVFE